jgi:hypothetical protein
MTTNPSIDLRVGGPLHKRVLEALNARFTFSARKMSNQHTKWRKSEDQFLAYIPEKDIDARKREARESTGKQDYTTIILPYTYASVMSAHSYWTSIFMARSPIFQYAARHGESETQTSAMEALVDYQVQVGKMLLPLFFWLLDPGKYGVGILGQYWCEETRHVSKNVKVPQSFLGFPTGKTKNELQTEEIRGYYGSKVFNIRPYDWYPDPRVALWDVQNMEFVGYARDIGWNEILSRAKSGEYISHNCEWARRKGFSGSSVRPMGSSATEMPNQIDTEMSASVDLNNTGPFGGVILHVNLVPKEWGLSESEYPEKWVFTCLSQSNNADNSSGYANLSVVIGARPQGSYHDKHPFFVLETEPDAYGLLPRSMAEVAEPVQRTMDWLINSHMYNVRNALNIQFLVDPAKVVMSDFKNPLPGGGIRLRPGAYGTPVNQVLGQVQVQDVTAGHIPNMQYLDIFGQKALGINEQILGMAGGGGGRKTATEIRSSSSFGVNRQKTITEMFSAMGFDPLSEILVQESQQWFDVEMKLRAVGDQIQQAGQNFLTVDPQSIQGFFDFVPVDGTLPIDRFAQANLWKEILVALPKMPQVAMQYDVAKIFAYTAQIAGLRAINKFRIQIAPDAQVAAMAQAGNAVPARGARVNGAEPAQIPSLGPTG